MMNQNAGYAVDPSQAAGQPGMMAPQPMMMQAAPMMMGGAPVSPEVATMQKDLKELKELKKSSSSEKVYCPMCQKYVHTKVTRMRTHQQFGMCICFTFWGCWLGCCTIPFCVDHWYHKRHDCESCKAPLGVRKANNFC